MAFTRFIYFRLRIIPILPDKWAISIIYDGKNRRIYDAVTSDYRFYLMLPPCFALYGERSPSAAREPWPGALVIWQKRSQKGKEEEEKKR
ncbi:MAG: hypothetical protein LBK67_12290 [Coriobacteriales bacterium]|jgi:hypothetical protein|nr:hypothetical protein [Coriobacteriales bacterium]